MSIVQTAQQYLGDKNYINWCQRFVEKVTQGKTGLYPTAIAAWNQQQGKAVKGSGLQGIQPGDVIYFNADNSNGNAGHTGIYEGNGKMISATYNGVTESDLGQWVAGTGQQVLGYIPQHDPSNVDGAVTHGQNVNSLLSNQPRQPSFMPLFAPMSSAPQQNQQQQQQQQVGPIPPTTIPNPAGQGSVSPQIGLPSGTTPSQPTNQQQPIDWSRQAAHAIHQYQNQQRQRALGEDPSLQGSTVGSQGSTVPAAQQTAPTTVDQIIQQGNANVPSVGAVDSNGNPIPSPTTSTVLPYLLNQTGGSQ